MLKRMASALGWATAPTAPTADEPAATAPAAEEPTEPARAPRREQVVALLVPESGGSTFRLRAVPDTEARPDAMPDGAGSIYRTGDGRIALDWHRAS